MWPPDVLSRVSFLTWRVLLVQCGWCAPPQTQIFESWAVREAMSKVAVFAGAESACELATTMPRWVHLGMDHDRAVRAATVEPLQGPKQDNGGDDDD